MGHQPISDSETLWLVVSGKGGKKGENTNNDNYKDFQYTFKCPHTLTDS